MRLLHLSVAAILIALLLWKADVRDVGSVLTSADQLEIIVVLALNVPVALLLYARAVLVLSVLGHRVPARILAPASILGNVAGSLTPAALGELLRAGVLRTQTNMSVEDTLALVAYERAMSVYLLVVTTGAIASFLFLPIVLAIPIATAGALLVLLPAALSPLLRLLPDKRDDRTSRVARVLHRALGAAEQLRVLCADLSLLMRWGTVTMTIFCLNALQFWLLARSVSAGVSVPEAWVAFGASQLAGIASLLPLGLGAADGSLAAVLQEMGLSLDEGAGVAVLVRLATTLPLGVAAIASYFYLMAQTSAESRGGDAAPAAFPEGADAK